MKKHFLSLFLLVSFLDVASQEVYTPKAHSHNDYENSRPFSLAFEEGFYSVEADIHLHEGMLLVGHDKKSLKSEKTLETLYLNPIEKVLGEGRSIQLLIDLKTNYNPTLDSLIVLLKRHPLIINNDKVKIVISGNRPPESLYTTYPTFIWFDGRPGIEYKKEELERVALISESYISIVGPKSVWPVNEEAEYKILSVVQKVHKMGKPFRFWGTPDFPDAWTKFRSCGVDFINTDKVVALSDYLIKSSSSLRQLPYNRVLQSAGKVVRYGKPDLENHALDVADLREENLVVVEERYGIFILDILSGKIVDSFRLENNSGLRSYMSTYSGIKVALVNGKKYIVWGAAERSGTKSAIVRAQWNGKIGSIDFIPLEAKAPAINAIPNDLIILNEGVENSIFVVLNGNNEIVKFDWDSKKVIWVANTGIAPFGIACIGDKLFVSNWAGPVVTDTLKTTAPTPWHLAYTDPATGATLRGSISVFEKATGHFLKEISVGMHPTHLLVTPSGQLLYVSNGSSDNMSIIEPNSLTVVDTIKLGLFGDSLIGSTPNGLDYDASRNLLFVSNGHDNAVAVVEPGVYEGSRNNKKASIRGFIPTEAFPAGLVNLNGKLVVCNLESEGANVIDSKKKARSIHHELASVSIIDMPDSLELEKWTAQVFRNNNRVRAMNSKALPRPNRTPVPVPERIGEPSVFKHVVYIIKENKTYDQVFGDLRIGNGDSSLCVFGESITPNMHALVKQFGLMDNFHASGKSSAEGHQWTDGGIVSDYVEKNVRAWFRSYPHRQDDALVYTPAGFIWNHAIKYGKTVRVFGEACETEYDRKLNWFDLYKNYQSGIKPNWYNKTTIDNLSAYISKDFPDCDNMVFSDQQRADIFINEWNSLEKEGQLPQLMVLSLPNDHSAGTSPEFPTPEAMVADNDLAVGRIIEMISKSKYWDSTVIFITQDDSQGGWDHVSAYRTVGAVVSAYSGSKVNSTYYNQVSMLRTIEQILGIPPMNTIDATSRLMTDCFVASKVNMVFDHKKNLIPLDQKNKPLSKLKGKDRKYALLSQNEVYNEVDGGGDEVMNKILWHYFKGEQDYPAWVKLK